MRHLGVGLLLLLLVACSVGRPEPDATGEEIYRQLCSNCHGEDLSGGVGPPLGPGSNSSTQPDSFLLVTIEHGRGRMPSFSTTLDEEQMQRLVEYIRSEQ
jgi:cytochrome c551